MEYSTAAEISKRWNISSRMVAYYCETGRIDGAVKKGKVWLIPAHTQKPPDKRGARQSRQNKCNPQGEVYHHEEPDIGAIYHTGDVYHDLGLTRETLRYYEKIGLIRPKRNRYSQYREFDLFDISRLMAIDFFKKRGFTPVEIRELQNSATLDEYANAMQTKINFLRKSIDDLTETLERLEKSRDFYNCILDAPLKFSVKEFPLYHIQDTIGSVTDFSEYKDKVLNYLNIEKEDILSNLVRVITFDKKGYKTSGLYIVKPSAEISHSKHEACLERGKCLYTAFIADNDDSSIPERMFSLCHEWAQNHGASFRGVVYIFIRFVTLYREIIQHYYEVWVPLKN